MMDGPLNLAHQQGRKAEKLLSNGNYGEAVACHQRAAELIDEALLVTSKPNAVESLKLQKENHLKQKEIIEMRKQKAAAAEKVRVKEQQKVLSRTQTKVQEDSTDGQIADSSDGMEYVSTIYRTMVETDSLLQFLNKRSTAKNSMPYSMFPKKGTSSKPLKKNGSKIPKDDKQIIEELKVHNEELRRHLENLLIELEESKNECRTLREKLNRCGEKSSSDSDGSETFCAVPSSGISIDDLPSLDLPPLDMPKFDFQPFKDFSD